MKLNAAIPAGIAVCIAPAAFAQLAPIRAELHQSAAAYLADPAHPGLSDEASAGSAQPDPDPFSPYNRSIFAHRALPGSLSTAGSSLTAAFIGTRSLHAAGSASAAARADPALSASGSAGASIDLPHLSFRILRPSSYRLQGSVLTSSQIAGAYANTASITLSGPSGIIHRQSGQNLAQASLFEVTGVLDAGDYEFAAECLVVVSSDNGELQRESSAAWEFTFQITPLCRADVNNDGFVDFFDFTDFATCFDGYECPAGENGDFNDDGFMDFFDYYEFIDAFETGC